MTPSSAPAQEAPRRRSTIREAAPVSSSAPSAPSPAPAPAYEPPAPVVSSTAPETAAAPKRGWWGKRLLGGTD
jgi:ribonuclease E